ncbi:hypothetical protein AT864_01499 [Anoxybacillus sp. P3H1B]|uniref:hypothetical protein n=1 Tax=Anoxybacillus sp. P3H1B TaxID=1769293 RepID=UPI00079B3D5F|nr:hypothetical protein [Anoxybacillus sp. P3H1B]KXG09939.1 hypothetical protein AT864_01499 [Anoxybacillus sp. P3H1B]
MSFREEFIRRTKKIYLEDVMHNRARRSAEEMIYKYFDSLKKELKEEIEISSGELDIDIAEREFVRVNLDLSELFFELETADIEVRLISYDGNEKVEKLIDRITYKNNEYISVSYSVPLSYELLDLYLRKAFEKELNQFGV